MRNFFIFFSVVIASGLTSCVLEPPDVDNPVTTASLFIAGAPLHGSNGMAFDSSGKLYVATAFGGEIVVMDPQSGDILERFGAESNVIDPDDLAIGPDGSLYWTNSQSGNVVRRTIDGKVTSQTIGAGVNPITFSDDGRLFVARALFGAGDPGAQDQVHTSRRQKAPAQRKVVRYRKKLWG